MRALIVSAFSLAALAAAGAAQAAPSVEIKHAVARVVVIPEARTDIKVEFLTTNPGLPLKIETRGERVIIDGDLRRNRIRSCHTVNGKTSVTVRDVGRVSWENMPQIVIRTPLNVDLGAGGAVFGSVGRSDSLDLSNAGCGDWTVANVKGSLTISAAGSGDTNVGTAGPTEINIAGSGDVHTQAIAGGVEINIAGSGDVEIASIAGRLEISVAGSGDINVAGGTADHVEVNIAGSGDTNFSGTAGSLQASIMGSGDVHVSKVTGGISKSIMGSGSVTTDN